MKYSRILINLFVAAMAGAAFTSCSDNMEGEAYYTFTGQTVATYCSSNPDRFSIFSKLIEESGNAPLLSSYGHYTCFLPDNQAMEQYFARIGKKLEQLTKEEKAEIVFNHVIKSAATDYTSKYFEEGALAEPTMSENYLVVSYKADATGDHLGIYINKEVQVMERDIEVHNGIIHHVAQVICPSTDFIDDILADPAKMEGGRFTIFSEALKATHLADSIRRTFDPDYVCTHPYVNVQGFTLKMPTTKRYGYTLFAEPDEVMANAGIRSLADLEAYAKRFYTNDNPDRTSPDNALNKFVAYHILDRQMSTNTFLYNGRATAPNSARDRVEFYETMYTYRLLKINVNASLNRSERNKADFVGVDDSRSNISAINGYIHTLKSMLVYDNDKMINDVLNCRVRFDMFNVPPQLTNNNIRWQLVGMSGDAVGYSIPHDFCGKHLTFTPETGVTMWASTYWDVHQEDEMKLTGWYDFTLRLPTVPPGSYEVRVGYRPEPWRGIAQFFLDGQIQGIPRDLRITGLDPQVGWLPDTGGPSDAENDKAMRNRGYMKAPASMWSNHDNCSFRDMTVKQPLRMIIGRLEVREHGEHFLRAKNVYASDREYNGDYIELIPVSLIDSEDIY